MAQRFAEPPQRLGGPSILSALAGVCDPLQQPSVQLANNTKTMSRGDKRDRDRAKNQAKQLAKAKSEAKVRTMILC